MADFVFNISKGKVAELCENVGTGSAALIVVPFGGTDTIDKDDDTLTVVKTHATENTDLGRKTITSVTVAVDDTGDKMTVDMDDITWSSATSSDDVLCLVICYDANTGSGDDDDVVPLTHHDFTASPDGNDITVTIPSGGFYSAS